MRQQGCVKKTTKGRQRRYKEKKVPCGATKVHLKICLVLSDSGFMVSGLAYTYFRVLLFAGGGILRIKAIKIGE
jgi:hypothetical protein